VKQQGTLGAILALRDLKHAAEELCEAADALATACERAKADLEARIEPAPLELSRLMRAGIAVQAAILAHEEP
jgi:hypothetical protein